MEPIRGIVVPFIQECSVVVTNDPLSPSLTQQWTLVVLPVSHPLEAEGLDSTVLTSTPNGSPSISVKEQPSHDSGSMIGKMEETFGNGRKEHLLMIIKSSPNTVQLLVVLAFIALPIYSTNPQKCITDGSNGTRCIRAVDSSAWRLDSKCTQSQGEDSCGGKDMRCRNSKCECSNYGHVFNGQKNVCEEAGNYGEPCWHEPLDTCRKNVRIVCNQSTSKCDCDSLNTPYSTTSCGPFKLFGDECEVDIRSQRCPECAACDPQYALACEGKTRKRCACKSGFVPIKLPKKRNVNCTEPRLYGEECSNDGVFEDTCDKKHNLNCVNLKCACFSEFVRDPNDPRHCVKPQGFLEPCGDNFPPCNKWVHGEALSCNKTEGKCKCTSKNFQYYITPKEELCAMKGWYNQGCQTTVIDTCDESMNLECDSQSKKCVCRKDTPFFLNNANRCAKLGKYKDFCDGKSCDSTQGLVCRNQNKDFWCGCVVEKSFHQTLKKCVDPLAYADPCDDERLQTCDTRQGLACKQGFCNCKNPDFIFRVKSKHCDKKENYAVECQEKPEDNCDEKQSLECVNGRCACNAELPVFYYKCSKAGNYSDECAYGPPVDTCNATLNLKCGMGRLNRCSCKKGYVQFGVSGKECGKRLGYNQVCGANYPECDFKPGLKCKNGKCKCKDDKLVFSGMVDRCDKKGKYGEKCTLDPEDTCDDGPHFACNVSAGSKSCACSPKYPAYYLYQKKCDEAGVFGKKCEKNPADTCNANYSLKCGSKSKCECTKGLVRKGDAGDACAEKLYFNEICNNQLPRCDEDFGLSCKGSKCKCSKDAFVFSGLDKKCVEKGKHGDTCTTDPVDTCDEGLHFGCDSAGSKKCICPPEYPLYYSSLGKCDPIGVYGAVCDTKPKETCNTTLNLKCGLNKICNCTTGLVQNGQNGEGCAEPLSYNDFCSNKLPKCDEGLTCRGGMCKCINKTKVYSSITKNCTEKGKYEEKCTIDPEETCDDGLHFMCDTGGSKKCICAPEYPLYYSALGKCDTAGVFGGLCDTKPKDTCNSSLSLECGLNKLCNCTTGLVQNGQNGEGCAKPLSYNDVCSNSLPKCNEDLELNCRGGMCKCMNDTYVFSGIVNKCSEKGKHDDECVVDPEETCDEGLHLSCDIAGTKTCICGSKYPLYYPSQGKCDEPGTFGQACDKQPKDTCNTNYSLECGVSGACNCTGDLVRNGVAGKDCAKKLSFNDGCNDRLPRCDDNLGLTCRGSKCQCLVNKFVFNGLEKKCVEKGKHGDDCVVDPVETCDEELHVTCDPPPGSKKCICLANFPAFYSSKGNCDLRGVYGKVCETSPNDTCNTELNLQCGQSKLCDCTTGLVRNGESGEDCKKPTEYYETCRKDLPECHKRLGLACNGKSSKCKCKDSRMSYPSSEKKCIPKGEYKSKCDVKPEDTCNNKLYFACKNVSSLCDCKKDMAYYHVDKKCKPMGVFGDVCQESDGGEHTCKDRYKLICVSNSDVRSRCECEPGFVQHGTLGKKCSPPGGFKKKCSYRHPECDKSLGLTCSAPASGKCVCNATVAYSDKQKTCIPKQQYGEYCEIYPENTCDDSKNFVCDGSTLKCSCKDPRKEVYFPEVKQVCQKMSTFRQYCEVSSSDDVRGTCRENVNLMCENSRCVCSGRRQEEDTRTGGCKDRKPSFLNGDCEFDMDCRQRQKLHCASGFCRCDDLYEPDPGRAGKCRRIPSKYDEACDRNSHCLQHHKMECDLKLRRCRCEPKYQLQQDGTTPCEYNPFGGRTYDQYCNEESQSYLCYGPHNLRCVNNICECLHGYIRDPSTMDDPDIFVTTCKPGSGTQEHGQNCSVETSENKLCNADNNLVCESVNKICTCESGYIWQNGTCIAGNQTYGGGCDPDEVIIPGRPVDPLTNLTFPGPTSPPSPKLACSPKLHLVCFKGKCICKDENVAGRFVYDHVSGRCFIANGYSCDIHESCLSKKCYSSREASGELSSEELKYTHDHDSKVCCCLDDKNESNSYQAFQSFFLIGTMLLNAAMF